MEEPLLRMVDIVLTTSLDSEPSWLVHSADAAAAAVTEAGGRVISAPSDIPVGRVAVVEDPFGNRLVLLDLSKGRYRTDEDHSVVGIDPSPWPGGRVPGAARSPAGEDRERARSAHPRRVPRGPRRGRCPQRGGVHVRSGG